jgi:glycosyltransferase involved in cell wall biosynthesis
LIDTRFALISHILPPSPSGQAVVLYRILSGISPHSYYLIHSRSGITQNKNTVNPFHLDGKNYGLPFAPTLNRPNRLGLSFVRNALNMMIQVCVRTWNIVKIIHSEPSTNTVIACSGDLCDIPAGFLASKITRLPFVAYIFDDYVYQWSGAQRTFANRIAPIIFKHAAGVIGPNEFICQEYQNRYGVKATLVRNPFGQEAVEDTISSWPVEKGKIKIIYTGAIYHANYDCFRNLIQAIQDLAKYRLELHIYTSQTPEELESHGIQCAQIIFHAHLPYREIIEEQQMADILFLPLAFESPIPEVIRTSAPGKMGEYLRSGKPVLAHVPADSFVASFFVKHQCGWLADQKIPQSLPAVIEKLITNDDLRDSISRNAKQVAQQEFSPEVARHQFTGLFLEIAR